MEPWSFIKERLKRQLSLFTAIAMMLVSVFGAMPVMAEGVPTFAVSSATANPGDTVDITINIENNPGITSAAMDVKFPDELTLTDVTLERNTYTGPFNGPQSFPVKNSARLNWANGLADTDTSGLFATLTFAVSDTAAEGTYAITVTYDPDDVFNVAEDNIDFHVSNGSITIGHKLTKVDAKDATCAEPGNSAYWICSNCGKFFADEAGKTEIEENSWVISAAHTLIKTDAKAATCTEVGNSAYWTCSTCGKYFSDEAGKNEIAKDSWVIPAGHNLTKTEAKAATCTEDGNNAYYTCSACGKIFKDAEGTQETTFKNEILAAIGHMMTKTDAKAATCTEDGNNAYYTCSACGKIFKDADGKTATTVETEKIAATGHTMTKTEAKAATCTEDGNNEYYTCSACGKAFKDADGKTVTTVEAETIAATGHTMTKTDAKAATCTEDGNIAYWYCSVCNKYFSDENGTNEIALVDTVVKAHHTMTKTDAKEPTCTAEGNNAYYTCSVCGKVFKDEAGTQPTTVEAEILEKKAHTPVVDAAVAATCEKTGLTEGSHCSVCNEVLVAQKVVDKIPHTLTKTDAKAATCTEDGNNEYYTCSACRKVFKDADGKIETTVEAEKIAAAGHTMTKTDAKDATCTEDGNTAYWYCSVCKKYFADENGTTEIALDDTVVKAHHTMTKTDAKEPTCTAEGNNAYYTCSVCGKVFKDEAGTQPTTVEAETLEKKAHTPVVDAAVAATCEKTGLTEGSHCSVCNEVLVAQKVVDKIPHTVVIDAAVEPTYSSTGLTEGKHCSVCNEVIEKQTVIPAKSETNVTVSGDEAFAGSKKELADAVLSAEDIESINNGKTVTINLKVTPKSDVTDAIKEQAKAKANDYTIGAFYDIDITKSIDGGTPIAVTSTNSLVHIQLTLADSLINTNSAVKRNYKVVRFHYDEAAGQTTADILEATYHAGYNKLSFDSDKFSVYAVVYKDTEIVTTTPTPAPTTKPDSTNVSNNNNSNTNNSNSTVEKPSVTGKVCPVCGYNNCKLGNDNRWHCGKCAHSWQEYGQTGSTSATSNAPKSPKTGLF
ncbi:cohesin domain-containing protein [uncultured Gemmiger sp.]|uniref:cohesin domain-containing protein n=1 Tax=uncultured Gemmiger sp. TaxID=1623490 RepID=UPI0025DAF61A|nr:cohesin domain-containing protein [uncultured Gemmiger sp.]